MLEDNKSWWEQARDTVSDVLENGFGIWMDYEKLQLQQDQAKAQLANQNAEKFAPVDQSTVADRRPDGQWVPWFDNQTVIIGGVALAALAVLSMRRGR